MTDEMWELVLRSIADDYESFERVLQDVSAWASERGLTADRQSTLGALEGLIGDGYAQAYVLSAGPPGTARAAIYAENRLDELWFYVTPKGQRLVNQIGRESGD